MISDHEATIEDPRMKLITPPDLPPAAVQRVSFGMLPPEMQMQELQ